MKCTNYAKKKTLTHAHARTRARAHTHCKILSPNHRPIWTVTNTQTKRNVEKDMGATLNESLFLIRSHIISHRSIKSLKNNAVAEPSSLIARLHATPLMNKYPNRCILNQKEARTSLTCELHNTYLLTYLLHGAGSFLRS